MMAKVFCLVALFLLPMISSSSSTPCNGDSDCGNGYYCLSEICEECIPCNLLFHREPPSNNETICAKTELDCGNCLPGYLADELANERNFSRKCYAPEKLDSSNSPATEYQLELAITSSLLVFFVATVALIAIYKKIRWWKSPVHSSTVDLEKSGDERPQPSAPSDVEEATESNGEMRRLINPIPMSTFQVDRPRGASPIGPHHEYHPPVVDATRAAVPSSMLEISPSTNAPALEMPPGLFRQNLDFYNAVRPPILRSVSDSGQSHIRLSDYRPTTIRSTNSPGRECATPRTIQNCPPLVDNVLEVEAALTMKRR